MPLIERYRPVKGGYFPMLPVTFAFQGMRTRVELGVIDSGSWWTILPPGSAEQIGLVGGTLAGLPAKRIPVVGGSNEFPRCSGTLTVYVGSTTVFDIPYCDVLIAPAPHIILGRQDVFARLRFCFDEQNQRLEVDPYP